MGRAYLYGTVRLRGTRTECRLEDEYALRCRCQYKYRCRVRIGSALDARRVGRLQRLDAFARPALETLVPAAEARYWFCDRFAGHFVGAHLLGGQYNIGGLKNGISFLGSDLSKLSKRRYQGWFAGLGAAYGYAWILGKHWNLEAELGIGWIYTRYDSYPCASCGKKLEEDASHHYVGPTKAAINLVYTF